MQYMGPAVLTWLSHGDYYHTVHSVFTAIFKLKLKYQITGVLVAEHGLSFGQCMYKMPTSPAKLISPALIY